jgi:hypothetical protein
MFLHLKFRYYSTNSFRKTVPYRVLNIRILISEKSAGSRTGPIGVFYPDPALLKLKNVVQFIVRFALSSCVSDPDSVGFVDPDPERKTMHKN